MMFKEQIKAYQPVNQQEEQDQKVILDYLKNFEHNILTRENKFAHLTSSSFIVNQSLDKVLMVYHNLYQSWAWTGGHADGDTDLLAVAIKEAKEETGIKKVTVLSEEIMALDILPVWGHMKKGEYISSHQHLNVSYLLMADESEVLKIKADENSKVGWIPLDQLEVYCEEPQMMPVYEKLINKINQMKD